VVTTSEPVIIIHGLWVHGLAMGWLARRIKQDGFDAHSYSYPTVRLTLSENADRFARYCASLAAPRVHIVAHSMGGLVALKMLQMNRQLRCGRLILIGTPYTGSLAAQRLARFPGGNTLLGRSIAEWLREPRPAPDAAVETGIIAGTRGYGLGRLIAPDLPQPHDGVVTLSETAVPGVKQRVELKVGHTEMLFSREVARQCCAFLRNGRFA
jgi:pimeloyl-ACP methyl ester carboxylesterase